MAEIANHRARMREDEWEIDFTDTRDFLIETWESAIDSHKLSTSDLKQAGSFTSQRSFSEYVFKEQAESRKQGLSWKTSGFSSTLMFGSALGGFEALIQDLVVLDNEEDSAGLVDLKKIDTSPLWVLAYLNVKFCTVSHVKLRNTTRWMSELRRNLDLLVNAIRQSLENKTNDENSVRLEISESFEPIISILHDSVIYLQRHYNEEDFTRNWARVLESKIKENQDSIGRTTKHLRDVSKNATLDIAQTKNYVSELGMRDRIIPMDGSEKAIFPLELLPPVRTEHFTGRLKDIENIHDWLGTVDQHKIRKWHIYGRRGIGKTQIALEYARRYRKHYDAIFWIQCETKASLRQSFAEIAVALELEGAEMSNNFDENLMRVLRWLRHTQKTWLLIYDNAERQQLLKGYWPAGGTGSMLLTSRSYYNFFEDEHRHGETVKLFNDAERRELFLTLLGKKWQSEHLDKDEMMSGIEEAAIATLLSQTGGLPIAITHAARLIADEQINPSRTTRHFMDMFKSHFKNLPPRQTADRDPLIHALDTVWAISFANLSPHARTVLSCLSHLSPDLILIDLFFPSDRRMLTQTLSFCINENAAAMDEDNPLKAIQTVINPSSQLQEALNELSRKGLIKVVGRQISFHRTVQEAISFQSKQDLQNCFDAMVSLLYDAFPAQQDGRPLIESWNECRRWIQHVIRLAQVYKKYVKGTPEESPLSGMATTELFVQLLANSSWYLFEIADYEECLNMISIARSAAIDKSSETYALLMNTEGTTYYEMNYLGMSRTAMEICLEIRQNLEPPNRAEIANILGNLGNVETAEGNYEAALDYLEQAARIRESIGDSAAVLLAMNYMQIGRVYNLRDENTEAYKMYQRSEGILNKRVGRNKFFTAHLQYEYGNLQFKQNEFGDAGRSYEIARQMAKDFNPLHPLVAAACYKLGCVEFEQDHHKKALNFLSKALDIAEVRSVNTVEDGTIARIQWKMAEVMLDDPLATSATEGARTREDVEFRQRAIADKQGVDLRGWDLQADREKSFDLLVPGYFR